MRYRIFKYLHRHWDLAFLVVLLLIINFPLFAGIKTDKWVFYPGLVKEGEWWRVFTGWFTHITWYHLFLDSLPFFILYGVLEASYSWQRLSYVFLSGTGNILAVVWFAPEVRQIGLSGFSGITYGIMAISSLEMIFNPEKDKSRAVIGLIVFFLLVALVLWESITGRFPFEFFLFGMVGKPILVCHAGGVLGAIFAFFLFRFLIKDVMLKK